MGKKRAVAVLRVHAILHSIGVIEMLMKASSDTCTRSPVEVCLLVAPESVSMEFGDRSKLMIGCMKAEYRSSGM